MRALILLCCIIYLTFMCMPATSGAQNSGNAGGIQAATDTALANQLFAEMKQLMTVRQLAQAQEKGEQALALFEKALGPDCKQVGDVWHLMGIIAYDQGKYDPAIARFQTALDARLKVFGPKDTLVAEVYGNLGACYYAKGNYDTTLLFNQQALNIQLAVHGEDHLNVAASYNNMGNLYSSMGDYEKAIEYFQKSVAIKNNIVGEYHRDVAISINNIGFNYRLKGDYNRAIEYAQRAYNIRVKVLGETHEDVAHSCNTIGTCYYFMGKWDKAIGYFNKSLAIWIDALGVNHPYVGYAHLNLAGVYLSKEEFDQAIDLYHKAFDNWLKVFGENHPNVAFACLGLGLAYGRKEEYSKAIEYYQRALQIRINMLGENHPDVAHIYNGLGESYFRKGEYDTAIVYCQKAIDIRLNKLGAEHPDVGYSYDILGNNYQAKGDTGKAIFYFQQSQDILQKALGLTHPDVIKSQLSLIQIYKKTAQYDVAWRHIQQAVSAIQAQAVLPIDTETKGYYQTSHHAIYEQAIDVCLVKSRQEDSLYRSSFTYAEKGKASLLQAQMKAADALAFNDIPDSLIQLERDLRIDITWREKQRKTLIDQGKAETDTTVLRINNIVFDLRQEYDSLKSFLEKRYINYYEAKYDLSTLTVEQVQRNLLQPGQSLVEYVVGDSSLFIFLIQPDYYGVQEVKIDSGFQQLIQKMTREGIYGFYGAPKAKRSPRLKARANRNYAEAAAELYNLLIAPIKDKLTTSVIIIPDGALGYVPFEALLSEKPAEDADYSDYPFFVKTHQLSYSYSATLLKTMRDKQHRQEPGGKLLALAPFFGGDADTLVVRLDSLDYSADLALKDSLSLLPASGLEVKTIANLLRGDSYYGDTASIGKFQELAPQYRILHLSTHAKADDRVGDYAYLAFGLPDVQGEFARLYARDLYNLSLNADMVVLSACETGAGKLQRGEGIVSLARAFAYAGAKSIMTTLWKVEEQATKDLAIAFYKYLKKRKTKDEALRLAKMEYLKKNKNNGELLHPFFWAGMIGIGDMGAVR